MCGSRLDDLTAYAELLADVGVTRGLIGPREVPRLWDRHLLNCAVVAPAVRPGASVVDVGSGAGLPGLVWAVLRPDLEIVLLEPRQTRADFLTEAASALGLGHVRVDRSRAEDVVGRYRADVVTARAVAPLERLLGWTLPLLRPGGRLLAFKGRSAADELAAARGTLSAMGGTAPRVTTYGDGILDPPTTVVEVTAIEQSAGRERPARRERRGRRRS